MDRSTSASPSARADRLRAWVSRASRRAALAVWFAVMLAVGAVLLARHEIALPRPSADPELARAIATLRGDGERGLLAVHVLYAECRCSQRIARHLVATARPSAIAEHVLLVGKSDETEKALEAHGFRVTVLEPGELGSRFHIVAAPLLVVAGPDGEIRYAGGYTSQKQGPDPKDLKILGATARGESPPPLPVLGCAVSEELNATLNPLGLP